MIKCERNSKGETVLEAQGNAITLAADCCEIISAIYIPARLPVSGRRLRAVSSWLSTTRTRRRGQRSGKWTASPAALTSKS